MRVSDLIPWKSGRSSATPATSDTSASGERDPIAALQSDINRAFENFFLPLPLPFSGLTASLLGSGSGIPVDVAENDKEVKVTAELPGLDEGDIDISVREGGLVLSGEKKTDREVDANGYLLRERSFGRIERTVPLPDGIDADQAQASFKNGVLTVTIPKTAEAQNGAKRIPVRSN
ncbi:MAG TPA: Hsp20/alpha crystallin family protein [Bosea sp. (in: a-proteobacteria)]|jgi:HSP20 family protein|nr:Hsp20/alpha crystallin family protein [Bosea sp. (in: a-proteobacteria)]